MGLGMATGMGMGQCGAGQSTKGRGQRVVVGLRLPVLAKFARKSILALPALARAAFWMRVSRFQVQIQIQLHCECDFEYVAQSQCHSYSPAFSPPADSPTPIFIPSRGVALLFVHSKKYQGLYL